MSGTELAYGATRVCVASSTPLSLSAGASSSVSSYALAVHSPVLTSRSLNVASEEVDAFSIHDQ
eukprot:2025317-Rhodomonas_salina.1